MIDPVITLRNAKVGLTGFKIQIFEPDSILPVLAGVKESCGDHAVITR